MAHEPVGCAEALRLPMSPRISTRLLATQSDERLVALVRQGHERAFEALVHRYRKPLLHYCRRMLSSEARAEDVLQQTLMRAWMALRNGTDVRELKPWLYRIAHNTAINAIRSPAAEHRALGDDGRQAEENGVLVLGAEQSIDHVLEVRDAFAGMAALPPMQREVMVRTAVGGHSHEEVASALGITDGAVRGLLYRARATLRTAVTAITPPPLVGWLLSEASKVGFTYERVAEMASSGGGPGLGGALLKGGAVIAAAGAVVAGAGVGPAGHRALTHHRAVAASAHSHQAPGNGAAAAHAHGAARAAAALDGRSGAGSAASRHAASHHRRAASSPMGAHNAAGTHRGQRAGHHRGHHLQAHRLTHPAISIGNARAVPPVPAPAGGVPVGSPGAGAPLPPSSAPPSDTVQTAQPMPPGHQPQAVHPMRRTGPSDPAPEAVSQEPQPSSEAGAPGPGESHGAGASEDHPPQGGQGGPPPGAEAGGHGAAEGAHGDAEAPPQSGEGAAQQSQGAEGPPAGSQGQGQESGPAHGREGAPGQESRAVTDGRGPGAHGDS